MERKETAHTMSNASYEKVPGNMANAQELPPPYSDPLQPPIQPPAPIDVQPPPMPSHLCYAMAAQDPKEEPILQPVQVTKAPDYLAYSIFTMLCCCLPLGVAALVCSILTREANHAGNRPSAQRNSRMARMLAHSALGVGIAFIILYIVYFLFTSGLLK